MGAHVTSLRATASYDGSSVPVVRPAAASQGQVVGPVAPMRNACDSVRTRCKCLRSLLEPLGR